MYREELYRQELRKLIKLAGSQAKLAEKLKMTRAAINNCLNRSARFPVDKAFFAEAVFEEKVLAEKLSPHKKTEILIYKAHWIKKVKTDA